MSLSVTDRGGSRHRGLEPARAGRPGEASALRIVNCGQSGQDCKGLLGTHLLSILFLK